MTKALRLNPIESEIPNGERRKASAGITNLHTAEGRQKLTIQVLELLNQAGEKTDTIRDLLFLIKESTGFEAAGIRLREGEDFPYYETSGFPAHFVEAERYLCARDQAGELIRDSQGNPCLECMCGNIICGRTDPSLPFFTEGGSFWTNGTTELLASTTEKDRQARTLNRCNGEGYESVGLIPLRSDGEIAGLLQLNDSRKGMFAVEMIKLFEEIGASIGIAIKHKKAEENLRESEKKYRDLINNIPVMIYKGKPDWSTEIISKCEAICGYSVEAFNSKKVNWLDIIHPDDKQTVTEESSSLHEKPMTFMQKYRIITKDGSIRWVSDHKISYFTKQGNFQGVDGVVVDITDKKEMEAVLRKSRNQFKTVIDSSPALIYLKDLEGRYLLANRHLALRANTAVENISGKTDYDFMSKEIADVFRINDQKALETGHTVMFEETAHENNELRTYLTYKSPVFDAEGNPYAVCGVSTDITEQKRANEQLRKALEDLQQIQSQLLQTEKMASIGQLAAGVAHEINNPITAIMLNAPIFEKIWNSVTSVLEEHCRNNGDMRVSGMSYTQLKERVPLLLADIKNGAMRVKRIIKDLKDFARQEPSELTDMVDANRVTKAAVRLVSNLIKKATDHFEAEYDPDIPGFKGNTQRIEQVIVNLLINACQALPDKERSIRISTAYNQEPGIAVIRITDQGAGMPPEVLQRIRTPFFTTKRESGGTGLGLAISEKIMEDHGGTMTFDSNPSEGTTVTLRLPENASSEGKNGREAVK